MKKMLGNLYLKMFPCPSMREEILHRVMRLASLYELRGDYLEFGVDTGKSFTAAYHIAQKYNLPSMKFYAFDSFQGLPESKGVDKEVEQFKKGEYACSEEQFRENLRKKGVDMAKVTTVPGWYDNTLNDATKKKLPLKSAAVVWIDCDLYESTVPVLNFLTDYAQDGTILIFDDWFCFRGNPGRGEQRAFREWLERNPSITASEYYKHGFWGNSFILHRD